jgi:uncharacterized phiE125 gp8 family phage protein
MRLSVVTAPEPVVTLEEAKQYLRVIGDHDDAYINRLIKSATEVLDGPTGILGRALGPQQWEATWDSFREWHVRGLRLPILPLISIDEIAYRTEASVAEYTEVIPASDFSVFDVGDTIAGGYVTSVAGWPSLVAFPDAVRIRFTVGYPSVVPEGGGDPVSTVPEPIKQAILCDVKIGYDKPTDKALDGLEKTYTRLISGFRKRRI